MLRIDSPERVSHCRPMSASASFRSSGGLLADRRYRYAEVAADVFVYLAELEGTPRRCTGACRRWTFAFTAQTIPARSHPGRGRPLRARGELSARARGAVGLSIAVLDYGAKREHRGRPVPGCVCVMAR